jgi:lipoprotein-anchoring transpeptidase ErfK/SrfK
MVPGTKPGKSNPADQLDQEVFLLQIYLDREGFSAGPISGKTNLDFQKLVYLYQVNHPEFESTDQLRAKALAGVGEMLSTYTLKHEDFRFIAPPKAQLAPAPGTTATPAPRKKRSQAVPKPTPVPPPVYAEMTASPMLAYRSPWEFVAERFHCREDLLRQLNPGLKPLPAAGTEFRVPNVVPFAIENAFRLPLQPPADPQQVTTAAIVDLSRMEIYRNDRLVAVMPVFPARPGLRGRGTWKILDAVPRPQLATLREEKDARPPTNSFYKGENPEPEPEHPVLKTPEFLPAGPNNPVGIFWVNLSKSENLEPLPFGLHGTGIPSELKTRYGLGGFRLTNWDIARAVRLLPVGTPLHWKQPSPMAPPTNRPPL